MLAPRSSPIRTGTTYSCPRRSWRTGRSSSRGGTLEQLFAGTKGYPGSTGRGFVVALEPTSGKLLWKHDVGPKPAKLDPPVVVEGDWGKYTFDSGPATSSVWSTPDVRSGIEHNLLRHGREHRSAAADEGEPEASPPRTRARWCAWTPPPASGSGTRRSTQMTCGRTRCEPTIRRPGLYKDCSIGDSPKILTVELERQAGQGCRRGLQEWRFLSPACR